MTKIGRNDLCPCGSGRKAKHCCGVVRGPGADELDRAYVASEALTAAAVLADCDKDVFDTLWEEMLELPQRHLSLQIPLPKLVRPEVERLIEALQDDDDDDEADDALHEALALLDTPAARAALTRAVVDLRDSGRVGARLAAVAIIELASPSRALMRVSLAEAAAVAAGVAPTPGGIVLADRLAA